MRRTHGLLLGLALVSSSLVGCGGGGGGGAPGGGATAALNAEEQSLLGTWTLVGFDLWLYGSGEHYTQNSFASFSGSLTFSADGTADGTLCLNNSCAAFAARVETPDAAELPVVPFGRAARAAVDAN